MSDARNLSAAESLGRLALQTGITLTGGRLRRTSSRFCLGVEHGDYNGTELFGVGTDRFIWLAYRPHPQRRIRLFSGNFPGDGVIDFGIGQIPDPLSPRIAGTWARFPYGVDHILRREGYRLSVGMEGVILGDIPGGGMSRSASLTLNLILSLFDVNGIREEDSFRIVDLAQSVENDYIGSPCGKLDPIMILFAREGRGTHYLPGERRVAYVPFGGSEDFRLVSLDTGTDRPGLETSTYRIRRAECEELVGLLRPEFGIRSLAEITREEDFRRILERFEESRPDLCARLRYIYGAGKRFSEMLGAWKGGDIRRVGEIFREDGRGLRDDYRISGPELETMCDIARTVEGVHGERMLGGGDKGASGAICRAGSVENLRLAVETAFPLAWPDLAEKYAVHQLRMVEGVRLTDGLFR